MKRLTAMYRKAHSQFQAKLRDQKGATMVEYALMIALVAAVCVVTVTSIGTKSNNAFTTIAAAMK